ncbi:lytic transglycosylase domain-containing protein [Paraburkholderia sp. D15]|uniref:lytic transglycosylase domain-containing protein n=1 Tax=Paraburkholderia sp. D15 TaxID=2880218 RepID=UPI00247AB5FC|nr:transglycosylase SLT domain-containing protein [Paraburkholderia sp. D15]WGS49692.1 lytic transglycosylase domain-containing protein [Paraburkholderia sp. D15]WKF57620.1 Membrane-bound lytic murein transglycosylase C [Paraburkholderia busanensis]
MSRLLCLIVLSLGLMQNATADENSDRMTAYLTQKFGLAKEKAQKIADAVQSSASKYSLPPALLLAIISIESRFKEKAKGANGATGLMQVVPGAHRGLLRNVKDLTEPTANIDVGSAILYGYMRSANGDLNAALKSYGGSKAYAQKVSLRAEDFVGIAPPRDAAQHSDAQSAGSCEADRCASQTDWSDAFTVPAGSAGATAAPATSAAGASGTTVSGPAGSAAAAH